MNRNTKLLDVDVARDPYAFYAYLRREEPVRWDESVSGFLVSRYDDVVRAYKDRNFSTRTTSYNVIHGKTVISMEGDEHRKNRALLTPHFRSKGLDALDSLITHTAARMVSEVAETQARCLADNLRPHAEVDIVAEFTSKYPIRIMATMFGLPAADFDKFSSWYRCLVDYFANFAGDEEVAAAGLNARDEFSEYILPIIATRRAEPKDDFISTLVRSEVDGHRMSNDEIRSYVSLLLTAGGDTTSKTLGHLLVFLLEDPRRWAEVVADRELVTAAIAETLRMVPVGQISLRTTDEETELGGVHIPAGSPVYLLNGSANRDEHRYAEPDAFNLHRDDLSVERAFTAAANHVAFGAGRHFCLGALLAKAELETGLNYLMDAFPAMSLAEGHVPEWVGLKSREVRGLRVVLG